MNVNFRVAKTMFFDDKLDRKLGQAASRALRRFGAFVRRRAKSSLKKAKPLTLNQMTPEQRKQYEPKRDASGRFMSAAELANSGRKKVPLPETVSKPGQPPLLHTRPKSPLRELIFFVYDPREKAVLIGPTASNATQGKATGALEYGGSSLAMRGGSREPVTVAARPFMRPAFHHELPELRKLRNTVK